MTEQEAINVFRGFKSTPREMKAVALATESLEKQIPKKIKQEVVNGKMARWCPNGCVITHITSYASIIYCPYCGQRLSWEGEEL